MADETTHPNQTNRNQFALDSLLASPIRLPEWVAIAAFYKALHIVEAVLDQAETGADRHSRDHSHRNATLRRNYPDLWEHYADLFKASMLGRYLEFGSGRAARRLVTFTEFMEDADVLALLETALVGLENEVMVYLSAGNGLIRYAP